MRAAVRADDLPAADALERQVDVERVDRGLEAQVGDHHLAREAALRMLEPLRVDALQFPQHRRGVRLAPRHGGRREVGQARVAALLAIVGGLLGVLVELDLELALEQRVQRGIGRRRGGGAPWHGQKDCGDTEHG